NWNLGSGNDQSHLDFRVLASGQAPVITFKAENDVKVDASLTDGFFQITNPVNPGSSVPITIPGYETYSYELNEYKTKAVGNTVGNYKSPSGPPSLYSGPSAYYGAHGNPAYGGVASAPGNPTGTAPVVQGESIQDEVNTYLALYKAYADFLLDETPGAP